MKKNILICLEQLNIGGVETAVLNYAIGLIETNNVYVLSKDGIYKEILENNKIKSINFEYKLENIIDNNKLNIVEEIIDKYKINEVHIHQIPCIMYLIPILLKKKIPYIAFIHSNVLGSYEWFMKTYSIYNYLLPLYFKNANLIVAITKSSFEEANKLFKLNNKDVIYLNNSINLKLYKSKSTVKNIKNFLLISRFSKEKKDSIFAAIDFFKSLKNDNYKLSIIGDGELKTKIKEKIEGYNNICLLPQTNNISEIIENNEVVIGMGRCILEAIALERIPIISSYNKTINIITKENIEEANKYNFSGTNFKESNIDKNFNNIDIKKIIKDNYSYVEKNLNISNNINKISDIKPIDEYWYINEFELLNQISTLENKLNELDKEKYLSEQKLYKEIEELKRKNNELETKLSKKIGSKIKRVIKKVIK